jgi:hypothetical protein
LYDPWVSSVAAAGGEASAAEGLVEAFTGSLMFEVGLVKCKRLERLRR